ncbi:MAG TPA: GntR family transcriptional regulator [Dermatophilaceae bacterium]|nr:GntR family transcriptional regulator [Dermatophilaceae bacterium]
MREQTTDEFLEDEKQVRGVDQMETGTSTADTTTRRGRQRGNTLISNNGRGHRPSLSNTVRDRILEELILNGAVAPGERMPSEADLCDRYEVSRITVRTALRSLRDSGYIDVRQGLGTTVLPRAGTLPSSLNQLSSIESQAADPGALSTGGIEIEVIAIGDRLAAQMSVPQGSQALVVRRVKLLHGTPIAWVVDYIPEGVLPFDVVTSEFSGSVLDVLLAHRELHVEYSDTTLTALPANREQAKRLHVKTGTPVLSLEGVTLTRSGQAINVSHSWMLPEHFNFTLRRRRGNN